MKSDVAELIRELNKRGFPVRKGGKHYRVDAPDGSTQTIPSSPSDTNWRVIKERDLAKAGIDLRTPFKKERKVVITPDFTQVDLAEALIASGERGLTVDALRVALRARDDDEVIKMLRASRAARMGKVWIWPENRPKPKAEKVKTPAVKSLQEYLDRANDAMGIRVVSVSMQSAESVSIRMTRADFLRLIGCPSTTS